MVTQLKLQRPGQWMLEFEAGDRGALEFGIYRVKSQCCFPKRGKMGGVGLIIRRFPEPGTGVIAPRSSD